MIKKVYSLTTTNYTQGKHSTTLILSTVEKEYNKDLIQEYENKNHTVIHSVVSDDAFEFIKDFIEGLIDMYENERILNTDEN